MLSEVFPKKFPQLLALPVLGQIADDYDTWLSQQGYGRDARCGHGRALVRIDRDLRRLGRRQWQDVRQAVSRPVVDRGIYFPRREVAGNVGILER